MGHNGNLINALALREELESAMRADGIDLVTEFCPDALLQTDGGIVIRSEDGGEFG